MYEYCPKYLSKKRTVFEERTDASHVVYLKNLTTAPRPAPPAKEHCLSRFPLLWLKSSSRIKPPGVSMDATPQLPSLPRRLGRFLRRQWPLVVFVLVAVGSRCLTPVLWHESPDWALGTLGIAASIFLLKKFHLERRLFIYILPLLALMIFFNIIDTVNIHPNTLRILTHESHIPPDILDGLISAIFSLLFSPLFFKEMTILKSIRKIPLITFFLYIALSKFYLSIAMGIGAFLLSIGLGNCWPSYFMPAGTTVRMSAVVPASIQFISDESAFTF